MTTPDLAGLCERLRAKARASFEANKSFGRRGKEWAIETEPEWQAAAAATAHPQLLLPAEEQGGGKKSKKSKGDRIVPYQNDPQALEKLLLEPGGYGFSEVHSIMAFCSTY